MMTLSDPQFPETETLPDAEGGDEAYSDMTDQIIDSGTLLLDLLEEENEALRAHDAATVRQLTPRKERVIRLYADRMAAVAQTPALLDDLDETRRAYLKLLAAKIAEAVEENQRRLQAEIDAGKRLLEKVVSAVKEYKGKNGTYSRDAAMNEGPGQGRDTALALNKEL